MIFLRENPPNYKDIVRAFPAVADNKRAVFTYGDVCFNPGGGDLSDPLMLHEAMHAEQHERMGKGERGPRRWWAKFIADPNFRVAEELEAYSVQFRRFCELNKDRNKRATELLRIAQDLSSAQYGNCIGRAEAYRLIREKAGVPA